MVHCCYRVARFIQAGSGVIFVETGGSDGRRDRRTATLLSAPSVYYGLLLLRRRLYEIVFVQAGMDVKLAK